MNKNNTKYAIVFAILSALLFAATFVFVYGWAVASAFLASLSMLVALALLGVDGDSRRH